MVITFSFLVLAGCQNPKNSVSGEAVSAESEQDIQFEADEAHDHEQYSDDAGVPTEIDLFGCTKASNSQIAAINLGNVKYDSFMQGCMVATGNSPWCQQLTRPNPSSSSTFYCTYGSSQLRRLIHPDESTWANAYQAVNLIQEMQSKGISVSQIYNWWRPEPYNGNVGGAAGRHPFGTSIDVRFTTTRDMEKAHRLLCQWRAQGRLRAVGYYGSTGLHLGVGDRVANTWGKSCSGSSQKQHTH